MRKLVFQPGDSALHKLYPLTKLTWLILGSILVFILTDGLLLIVLAGIHLLVLHLLSTQIWRIRGFQFAFITGFLLLIFYVLFDKNGQVLISMPVRWLDITAGGVESGLRYSSRFLAIIFMSYLFILTTEPSQLADSLMKIGIPYRYGFMLVTALRLAPVLEQEGKTIYRAQLVRGVRYDRSSIGKIRLLVQQFMTPLLISALRRVDKLVFSLEGRGFGKYKQRTFRRQKSPSGVDLSAIITMFSFFAILIMINSGAFM